MLNSSEYKIIKIICVWAFSLLLATLIGSNLISHISNGGIGAPSPEHGFDYVKSLAQWDGGHFLSIARQGYQYPQEHVFFPLFPAILRFFDFISSGNGLILGLIFNFLCTCTAMILFYRILISKYEDTTARKVIFTYLSFPTSFFFLTLYSESLFMVLMFASIYFLMQKRTALAAAGAMMAGLVRFIGIFLSFFLFLEPLARTKFNKKERGRGLILALLSASGFLSYLVFLARTYNDPLFYFNSQGAWQRGLSSPPLLLWSYLKDLAVLNRPMMDYLDLFITLSALFILIYRFRKLPLSWSVFSLAVILPPLFSGTLTSMPRYILPSFGFFILLGLGLSKHEFLQYAYFTTSLMLQAILALAFINGYWVA